MKNILILYALSAEEPRKTIQDSLLCFKRYDNNSFYYLNILDDLAVYRMNKKINNKKAFDGIIIHYSAIAMRVAHAWWETRKESLIRLINKFDCYKILIPQDEYSSTNAIRELVKRAKINEILTVVYKYEDYMYLYPKELGYENIEVVFTGYVDDNTVNEINDRTFIDKDIDLSYRARRLPYYFGSHGQLKYELAEKFRTYLEVDDHGLYFDINNTLVGERNVIKGDSWIDFLIRSRAVLGCLGGASVVDWDGSIQKRVEDYLVKNVNASYDEVEEACFAGRNGEITSFMISPRIFECAMTKTCQILVEGYYQDVVMPDIDYVEIKRDFSNIEEVLEILRDKEKCEKIADNCYHDVVASGKYMYSDFVKGIVRKCVSLNGMDSNTNKNIVKICACSNMKDGYLIDSDSISQCYFSLYNSISKMLKLNYLIKEVRYLGLKKSVIMLMNKIKKVI